MNWENLLHRLQFHNYQVPDNEIDPIRTIEVEALARHRHINLPNEIEMPESQFTAHGSLIGRLQESGSKVAVNLDGGGDDVSCYGAM